MKTLIAYASNTGVTFECASKLAKLLPNCTLSDLTKERPDPRDYDCVVIGSSIRMGAIHKRAAEYLEGCEEILAAKRLGIFICCGSDEKADEYFKNNLPQSLLNHSVKISFGGRLDTLHAKGLDRFMIKIMLKSMAKDGKEMAFYPERIGEFARQIVATGL